MIQKKYLLLLGGLVWGMAGFNILRIGLESYVGYISIINIFLSIVVYGLFQIFIFRKMVNKHTKRIHGYKEEKQLFIKFFDIPAFCIMALMMLLGISLRVFHLVPDIFIAIFYTGLGSSLSHAGILFLLDYIQFTRCIRMEGI